MSQLYRTNTDGLLEFVITQIDCIQYYEMKCKAFEQ